VPGWISVWDNGSAVKLAGLSLLQWLSGVLVLAVLGLIFPPLSTRPWEAQRLRGESEEVVDSEALAEETGRDPAALGEAFSC